MLSRIIIYIKQDTVRDKLQLDYFHRV